MINDRAAKIVSHLVQDLNDGKTEPSIKLETPEEEQLYKCCLIAVKHYIKDKTVF